jgi:hypothetical protein
MMQIARFENGVINGQYTNIMKNGCVIIGNCINGVKEGFKTEMHYIDGIKRTNSFKVKPPARAFNKLSLRGMQ